MPAYALVLTGPHVTDEDVDAIESVLASARHPIGWPNAEILSSSTDRIQAAQWLFDADKAELPDLLALGRRQAGALGLDLNAVLDDQNRRKKLLIADMDSTIIEQECIDQIAEFSGHGAEVAAITGRAMRGELDFEEALETRVALLEGIDVAMLQRVFRERLTVMPGARELVATMAADGAYCALVSGGFTYFTSRIAELIGFHENRANTLEIVNDKLTGHPVPPILGRQAKLDALSDITSRRSLPMAATLAVGDGANDLAMIKAAGLGVAYRAKPAVAAEADARIDHSDLTALLYLQGYHRGEFIC